MDIDKIPILYRCACSISVDTRGRYRPNLKLYRSFRQLRLNELVYADSHQINRFIPSFNPLNVLSEIYIDFVPPHIPPIELLCGYPNITLRTWNALNWSRYDFQGLSKTNVLTLVNCHGTYEDLVSLKTLTLEGSSMFLSSCIPTKPPWSMLEYLYLQYLRPSSDINVIHGLLSLVLLSIESCIIKSVHNLPKLRTLHYIGMSNILNFNDVKSIKTVNLWTTTIYESYNYPENEFSLFFFQQYPTNETPFSD